MRNPVALRVFVVLILVVTGCNPFLDRRDTHQGRAASRVSISTSRF